MAGSTHMASLVVILDSAPGRQASTSLPDSSKHLNHRDLDMQACSPSRSQFHPNQELRNSRPTANVQGRT